MYDVQQPLNFNTETESGLIDYLMYANAVYNHEDVGMSWEQIKRIFPDKGAIMEAMYISENKGRGE